MCEKKYDPTVQAIYFSSLTQKGLLIGIRHITALEALFDLFQHVPAQNIRYGVRTVQITNDFLPSSLSL